MALGEAILVCLTDRPMSGYDLAKTFDASIGFFWRASHQQVYRELARLRERGLVESREIEQSGRPNRIVHTITKAGKQAVKAWSRKPVRRPSVKDELLVKLYALEDVDVEVLREQLEVRLDQHRERLATYLRIKDKFYEGRNLTVNQKGKLIALTMGIRNEKEFIAAFEQAIVMLEDIDA
ncbi:MAG TPA: PadR family transcriptional regulator [Hellea balneolensis]|uniref:PadR family transcriptional regulator n=1 Tax=Hellea balneolensis TaxID=287478 RepID=A0A7V5NX42_9PROT|nr:PadR family transcriptional regulator [Hellea balneolensis]